MECMKTREKASLKNRILGLLILGWAVPVLILAVLLGTYVDWKAYSQVEDTVCSSMEKACSNLEMEFAACETASKNASYYSDIRDAYMGYMNGGYLRDFENEVNGYLASEYKYNKVSKTAIIDFNDIGAVYYTYNNSAGGSYKNISQFFTMMRSAVMKEAEQTGTKTTLCVKDGTTYLVRNMMMPNYTPFAVLILEMNDKSLNSNFKNVWGATDSVLMLEGEYMAGSEALLDSDAVAEITEDLSKNDSKGNEFFGSYHGKTYVATRQSYYGKNLDVIVQLDNAVIYQRIYATWIIFALMVVFLIPLSILLFHFFHRNVTEPVTELVAAYDQVAEKNYGYQLEASQNSKEFQYMQDSFNQMSLQIKEQFETIVGEEIALRDAKIMALQSQINPHFLNNTFEIINWEARLNGNIKVSKMIEALSTMLEATMNRRGESMHSLAEEMSYVDAYAYIISERLGDKFSYHKEIDEALLGVQVPKLIIQPIVENAVEHGLTKVQEENILVRIREDGEFICIEIINDGALSEEDDIKIRRLLNEAIDAKKERSLNLGIRNVNNRLKLIFGEACGLTIQSYDEKSTISIIRVTNHPILELK